MKKLLLIIMVILFMFFSCEKDDEKSHEILTEMNLYGSWHLIDSYIGGWSGSSKETNFNTMKLEPISHYSLYYGTEKIGDGEFVVLKKINSNKIEIGFENESGNYFLSNEFVNNAICEIDSSNNIELYNTAYDGAARTYVFSRINEEK